jgi:flagellar protein FlbD
MIHVTRLDHKSIVVNAELIVTIESTPDTLVTLSSGLQFVVRESVGDVVSRVVEYRRQLLGTLKVVTAPSDRTVREEG